MYLLTAIGVIIAGLSLYYIRKSAIKEEEEEEEELESARERIEKPKSKPKEKKSRVSKNQTTWTHSNGNDIKIQEYSHSMIKPSVRCG